MENDIQMYEIYGYWHSAWYLHRFFFLKVIVGIIVGIFISYLIWQWWRTRNSRFVPAWITAQNALQELALDQFVDNPKQCYDTMSLIVKNYIKIRYDVSIEGLSDTELLDQIVSVQATGVHLPLEAFIVHTIIPRFSYNAGAQEHLEKVRSLAMEVVQKSIPS